MPELHRRPLRRYDRSSCWARPCWRRGPAQARAIEQRQLSWRVSVLRNRLAGHGKVEVPLPEDGARLGQLRIALSVGKLRCSDEAGEVRGGAADCQRSPVFRDITFDLSHAQTMQQIVNAGNLAYLEALYKAYIEDPTSVDGDWRAYFAELRAELPFSGRGRRPDRRRASSIMALVPGSHRNGW